MCGIAGRLQLRGNNADRFVKAAKRAHARRGPDDFGYALFDHDRVVLAHNRLSIIDLSSQGHQPMQKHGRTIVFNGEIYNFRELRMELERHGYVFDSHSDTEVILSAYDKWGDTCFGRFNGPFAVAIYDPHKKEILLARDKVGEKPLYYFVDSATHDFTFSSTIRFIRDMYPERHWVLDDRRIASDLLFNFWSDKSRTHVKDILSLMPGTYVRIGTETGRLTRHVYWDLQAVDCTVSEEEALGTIDELLQDAVKLRTSLDTKIGMILSGGLDSTLLTLLGSNDLAYRPDCFTLEKMGHVDDDLFYAQKVCQEYGLPHHKVAVRSEDLQLNKLIEVTAAMEEPALDQVYVYINRNYQVAHEHNLKAVLNGQGSDEIFLGYLDYYSFLRDSDNYQDVESFRRYWLNQSPLANAMDRELMGSVVDENLGANFLPYVTDDRLNSVLRFGVKTHLLALLAQEDKQSMAWSVECRTAFTDYRLVQYVSSLPSALKMKDGREKYLLRKLGKKYVPEYITQRKKLGFPDLPDNRQAFIDSLVATGMLERSSVLSGMISEKMLKYPQELPPAMRWKLCSIAIMEQSLT